MNHSAINTAEVPPNASAADDARLIVAITSHPPGEAAYHLARRLVESRLAACVHVFPVGRSVYRWESNLNDDAECLLLIKTTASRFPELEAFLQQHHPYDLPELIALDAARASEAYAGWVRGETQGAPSDRL